MQWTVGKIGSALGVGASFALSHRPVSGFSIDSRTVEPGQAFIALKGPHFDGHDFVRQALERGAVVSVVSEERRMTYPSELFKSLIGVLDTFQALQTLAQAARRAWRGPVIGITGSTGKTTTKDLLATLLGVRYRVLKSEGNLNNEYGVPLTLLRLEPSHEVAVLEMAMTHRGEIRKLCATAEPNIGLVTNVAPVHLESFDSVDEIAQAKRELIQGLRPPGIAVLNADDTWVPRFEEGFSGKVLRFGVEQPADVRAENVLDHGCAGSEFDLVFAGQRERVALPLPGRQHISNALAAFAVASLFKIELLHARQVSAHFKPLPQRGELVRFAAGFTVVNDTYNSNPRALAAMGEALVRTPEARRRLLLLGEMKELGPSSADLHREAGASLAKLGHMDFLIGVTGDARFLVEGARTAGFPPERALFFESKETAADWLARTVQQGDWVLLKGSRAVRMETLLDALRAHFELAAMEAEKV